MAFLEGKQTQRGEKYKFSLIALTFASGSDNAELQSKSREGRYSLGMSLLSHCPRYFWVLGEGFFPVAETMSWKVRICRRWLKFQ